MNDAATGDIRPDGGEGATRQRLMRETSGATGVGRAAVIGVVILALAIGIAISLLTSEDSESTSDLIVADSPQQAWFCPALPNGKNISSAISIVNATDAELVGTVQYHVEGDEAVNPMEVKVPANGRAGVSTADAAPAGGAATVTLPPGRAGVGARVTRPDRSGKSSGVAIYACSLATAPNWFFTIGNTSRGNSQVLHLYNPADQAAVIDITYLTEGGAETKVLNVAPRKPVTLDLGSSEDVLGRRDSFATIIDAEAGRVVAAQTLLPDNGTHGFGVSLGARAGAMNWYFPSVVVGGDATAGVDVLNLGDLVSKVTAQFTPSQGKEAVAPTEVEVASREVAALDLGPITDQGGFGLDVISDQGVVAELLGSDTDQVVSMVGASETGRRWLLPWSVDGVGNGRVFLQNPFGTEVSVEFFLLPDAGAAELTRLGEPVTLAALSRGAVTLENFEPPDTNAGLLVNATGPVVVAREISENGDLALAPGIALP